MSLSMSQVLKQLRIQSTLLSITVSQKTKRLIQSIQSPIVKLLLKVMKTYSKRLKSYSKGLESRVFLLRNRRIRLNSKLLSM